MTLSPSERVLRARIAGLACVARHGGAIAEPARKAFVARFEHEVDPNGELTASDRKQRADAAMRAHMSKLRLARMRKGGR